MHLEKEGEGGAKELRVVVVVVCANLFTLQTKSGRRGKVKHERWLRSGKTVPAGGTFCSFLALFELKVTYETGEEAV